jgi:Uma2 family endonuclease
VTIAADPISPSTGKPPRDHRWTYDAYQSLAEANFFFKRRVELLGGRIIDMAPQGDLHSAAISLALDAVRSAFGQGFWIRPQLPLHLDRRSGPEPDLSVAVGGPRDYVGKGHPKSALLVIEISDTTLWYDRRRKGPRYARAGYADYWIVNLIDACVEVYRKPVQDPSARLGWRYSDVSILKPPANITPLAAGNPILIADLLPLLPTTGNKSAD